jgi:hypothetical protein
LYGLGAAGVQEVVIVELVVVVVPAPLGQYWQQVSELQKQSRLVLAARVSQAQSEIKAAHHHSVLIYQRTVVVVVVVPQIVVVVVVVVLSELEQMVHQLVVPEVVRLEVQGETQLAAAHHHLAAAAALMPQLLPETPHMAALAAVS